MHQAEARANDKAVELFRNGRVEEALSVPETFLRTCRDRYPIHRRAVRRRELPQVSHGEIDFALDRGGNAVIFEANASMFVPPVRNDPKWNYRREATARILDAVTRLVASASSKPAASELPSG